MKVELTRPGVFIAREVEVDIFRGIGGGARGFSKLVS